LRRKPHLKMTALWVALFKRDATSAGKRPSDSV
jgi:hypothetical protein